MPIPQDTIQIAQDIITILIRYRRICHDIVTIIIRLDKEFPECYGMHLTVGSAWRTSPDHYRSVGLCYERIRLRSDNDKTSQITEDSNRTFSLFVLWRCLISNGTHMWHCVNATLQNFNTNLNFQRRIAGSWSDFWHIVIGNGPIKDGSNNRECVTEA